MELSIAENFVAREIFLNFHSNYTVELLRGNAFEIISYLIIWVCVQLRL